MKSTAAMRTFRRIAIPPAAILCRPAAPPCRGTRKFLPPGA